MPSAARNSLHGAATCGDVDELKKYVADKVDLEKIYGAGEQTALHMICSHRKRHGSELPLEAAEVLLKAGANVYATTGLHSSGITPMNYAAFNNDTALMELLVKYGALIDGKDDSGRTPLRCAAYNGNLAAAKWLVGHGADITIKDECKQPKTARQIAQACKHTEVLAYLKELETNAKGAHNKRSSESSTKQPAKRKKA